MKQWKTIFKFELLYWLKQPAIYIYAFIFFFLSSSWVSENNVTINGKWTGAFINSSIEIYRILHQFEPLLMFLIPVIIGLSVYRDFQANMPPILYSYPLKKWQYLGAKFASSFLVLTLISLFLWIGFQYGLTSEWLVQESIQPSDYQHFIQYYFVFLLPNLFLVSAIVFAVVLFSKNIYTGFVSVAILFGLKMGIMSLFEVSDLDILAQIFDPIAEVTLLFQTKYWTIEEANQNFLPMNGLILWNRLFWLGLSVLILFITYRFFNFSGIQNLGNFWKKKEENHPNSILNSSVQISHKKFPSLDDFVHYSTKNHFKTTLYLAKIDFKKILFNPPFILLVLAGIVVIFLMISKGAVRWDTENYPTTRSLISATIMFYSGLINLVTFVFGSWLVFRAKNASMHQLIDATATPNWVFFHSKILAIIGIQVFLYLVVMIGCILTQIANEYYHFEIGLYVFDLFGMQLIHSILWIVLMLLIYTLLNRAYLGVFLMLLTPAFLISIGQMAHQIGLPFLEKPLFRYNQGLRDLFGLAYSELDGYGGLLTAFFTYKLYWLSFGILLLIGVNLFWIRGFSDSFFHRIKIAKKRWNKPMKWISFASLFTFLSLGTAIYFEENNNNPSFSQEERKTRLLAIEEKLKPYLKLSPPKITSVKVNMDLFPEQRAFQANGEYTLTNKSEEPIDSILVNYIPNLNHQYQFAQPFEVLFAEEIADLGHIHLVALKTPLQPNDSLKMTFQMASPIDNWLYPNGYCKTNGTFINDEICPRFGNWLNYLKGTVGIKEEGPMNSPYDTLSILHSEKEKDSQFIDFESIISTSINQIALTPGYLQREWEENNRRYFHYKTNEKIAHSFLFCSGEFEVKRDKWNDINLEIYYKKQHDYNLDQLMGGMKAGLEFCTQNFSPYQFKQVRIIEFAQTGGASAHGFPNTIPWGEGAGFLANLEGSEDGVDYVFGGAVHEVAHQWWGHQVCPSNATGGLMLAESLSEYTNISVQELATDEEKVRKYLTTELEKYLDAHHRSPAEESPLMFGNPAQPYVHYAKGLVVFYALKEYLGVEKLNGAIRKFVQKVALGKSKVTTSAQLVAEIEQITPDSLQYLTEDLFRQVSFYDNKTIAADAKKLSNGNVELSATFQISKYRNPNKKRRIYNDEKGAMLSAIDPSSSDTIQSLPLADYLDVAIYSDEKIVFFERMKFEDILTEKQWVLKEKPTKIVLDPKGLMIDLDKKDNILELD